MKDTRELCSECRMSALRYVVRIAQRESEAGATGPESREDDREELIDALRDLGAEPSDIESLLSEGWPIG